MEEAVLAENIRFTYILQPALIGGDREEWRMGEWLAKQLFYIFDFLLLGPLKKYQSILPQDIARCMVRLANERPNGTRIPSHQIKKIVSRD